MSQLFFRTAGESHGKALISLVEGMPEGVSVDQGFIDGELRRRQGGYGRGGRQKIETDHAEFLGGVRLGKTIGSPIAMEIVNKDARLDDPSATPALYRPRPGHADLAGSVKWLTTDCRLTLERASARETAARVALGEVARQYLSQAYGIELLSHVVALGPVSAPEDVVPEPSDRDRIDADPVRCLDPAASAAMVAEIDAARKDGDTLGGVVEVVAYGLPPGLGSHVHWDRRLDGRLAGALMSIQAIKGVEVGDGFTTARRRGSQAHDEIELADGGIRRRTNRAGGIEGGMSTGEVLRVRAAMKPISTVPRALATVDVRTGEPARAINQRSDVTAVPAAGVVAEAMVALVLAGTAAEKFGGDSVAEAHRNWSGYLNSLVMK